MSSPSWDSTAASWSTLHVLKRPESLCSSLRLFFSLLPGLRSSACVTCVTRTAERWWRFMDTCGRIVGFAILRSRGSSRRRREVGGGCPLRLPVRPRWTRIHVVVALPDPVAVVFLLLLRIGEDFVCGLDRLEFCVEFEFVALISIRMILQSWQETQRKRMMFLCLGRLFTKFPELFLDVLRIAVWFEV